MYNFVAITCSALAQIINGTISYESSTFGFGSSATHSCMDGFFLSGSSTRRCEGDGSSTSGIWSGSAPICTGTYIVI